MNVLQHTRNELNLCLKENRPDRSYRDTLLIAISAIFAKYAIFAEITTLQRAPLPSHFNFVLQFGDFGD